SSKRMYREGGTCTRNQGNGVKSVSSRVCCDDSPFCRLPESCELSSKLPTSVDFPSGHTARQTAWLMLIGVTGCHVSSPGPLYNIVPFPMCSVKTSALIVRARTSPQSYCCCAVKDKNEPDERCSGVW